MYIYFDAYLRSGIYVETLENGWCKMKTEFGFCLQRIEDLEMYNKTLQQKEQPDSTTSAYLLKISSVRIIDKAIRNETRKYGRNAFGASESSARKRGRKPSIAREITLVQF